VLFGSVAVVRGGVATGLAAGSGCSLEVPSRKPIRRIRNTIYLLVTLRRWNGQNKLAQFAI
jgi:hypothetical protein